MVPEIPPLLWLTRMVIGGSLFTMCIFIQVIGLMLISKIALHKKLNTITVVSTLATTATFSLCTAGAATLFLIQAILWGGLYVHLGAISDFEHAISFSIGAFTTYGGSGLVLGRPWVLLSEIQAVNGVIAFGLTTAFLYGLGSRMFPNV